MKKEQFICVGLVCAIFWGCSGKKMRNYEISSADSVSNQSNDTLGQTKLVKTANMNFKVSDVKIGSSIITALTLKYKGMVMHHSTQSSINRTERLPLTADSVMLVSSYYTNADIVVKVPSLDVDDFMDQVSKMAIYVNSRNMDIQDKTLDYLSAKMKMENRSAIIAQQKGGKIIVKNPTAVMDLKDDMIDQEINNERIDEAVKYSTLALNFYQSNTIAHEVIANDDPSNFRLPFFTRLGRSFANGWVIFCDTVICITNLWMFVLTIAALFLSYKHYKRNKTAGA